MPQARKSYSTDACRACNVEVRKELDKFAVAEFLRATSPKYQLDLEIAKKSNFFKLAQNEALRALVTKTMF